MTNEKIFNTYLPCSHIHKAKQWMGQGNYALASHYFEGHDLLFGQLYETEIGNLIYLSDMEYVYEYKLSMKEIIEAKDVYIINDVPNETLLTLITCAEEGTKRLAVRAEFIQRYTLENAKTLTAKPVKVFHLAFLRLIQRMKVSAHSYSSCYERLVSCE